MAGGTFAGDLRTPRMLIEDHTPMRAVTDRADSRAPGPPYESGPATSAVTGRRQCRSDGADGLAQGQAAAAMLSRRWVRRDVPGMSRMLGLRCRSQASATLCDVRPISSATRVSSSACSGVKPPSGK